MKLTPEQRKEHSRKIKEGLAKSDKKAGRPRKIDHKEIIKLSQYKSVKEIAEEFGISRQAIYNIIK
jgi:DNA invertase Pin-like site-specific DNA recombinase